MTKKKYKNLIYMKNLLKFKKIKYKIIWFFINFKSNKILLK